MQPQGRVNRSPSPLKSRPPVWLGERGGDLKRSLAGPQPRGGVWPPRVWAPFLRFCMVAGVVVGSAAVAVTSCSFLFQTCGHVTVLEREVTMLDLR